MAMTAGACLVIQAIMAATWSGWRWSASIHSTTWAVRPTRRATAVLGRTAATSMPMTVTASFIKNLAWSNPAAPIWPASVAVRPEKGSL
jgi:hypothetical protein